jgi:hypothetical protein
MRSLLSSVFLLLSTSLLVAEEKPWIELFKGDKLELFTGKQDDWTFAKSVALDEKNPKKLTFEPGSGVLVNSPKGRAADLYTKDKFGDVEVHLEFCIPKGSNAGIKFHGHYEIQILDSFGKKELTGDDCGGIYPRAELKPKYHHIDKGIAPKVNASLAPGEWQTFDLVFRAPRFDKDGKKTMNAKIVKALLNGKVIHENQEMETPTGNNYTRKEMEKGPLMLQGDHGPVAFRHFKVRVVSSKN